jgi:hypothetical protein
MLNGQRYAGGGYSSQREALAAQADRRKAVCLGIGAKTEKKHVPDVISENPLEIMKHRYKVFMDDPQNGLPDLFDIIMRDLGLPYTFRDVSAIVRNKDKKTFSIPANLRLKIIARDGGACMICGRKPPEVRLHVDHVRPLSKGGLTEERNLRTLCRDCNLGKSDRFIATKIGLPSDENKMSDP